MEDTQMTTSTLPRQSRLCVQMTTKGAPCQHRTTNSNGDCGRHASTTGTVSALPDIPIGASGFYNYDGLSSKDLVVLRNACDDVSLALDCVAPQSEVLEKMHTLYSVISQAIDNITLQQYFDSKENRESPSSSSRAHIHNPSDCVEETCNDTWDGYILHEPECSRFDEARWEDYLTYTVDE